MHIHAEGNESKVLWVFIVTLAMMFFEIIYGYLTHSMALLADGYHMGCHALVLGLTFFAYVLIRKFKDSELFPAGASKIGTLTAYTSSIFLGISGVWVILEAIIRLIAPLNIQFNQALLVALIGFFVNLSCILIMEHKHNKKEEAENDKCNEDYNFKSAYYHIFADALTSILAIIGLVVGKFFGIVYFDSVIGILGGLLIIRWAVNLIKDTVVILIDMKTK